MPIHVCPRGGRESGSNWHFLVVVPQPVGSWIRGGPVVVLGSLSWAYYLTSCQDTSWQNAASILQFIRCSHANAEGWQKQALGHHWKDSKTHMTDFQIGISDIHVLCILRLGYTIIWWCDVCCVEFSVVHISMYDVMNMFCSLIRTCALRLKYNC